jgi:MFS family permease
MSSVRLAAWGSFGLTAVLFATGFVLTLLSPSVHHDEGWSTNGILVSLLFGLTLSAFPAVGVILATRRPANPIGWLLLAIGLCWGISGLSAYSDYGLLQHPGSLPLAPLVAAISSSFWLPAICLSGTFLILLFPDGRLMTRRWRWVGWLAAAGLVVGTLSLVLTPGLMPNAGYAHTRNPLGAPSAFAEPVDVLHLSILLVPLAMVLSAVSLVVRYRRSHGADRQQMKWLAAAAAVVAGTYGVVEPLSEALSGRHTSAVFSALQAIALCTFGLVPIAIGFAVLRYRLYEIDRLISRTLSYALITGLLGGLFLGLVFLTTDVLPFSSPVGVAASTLAAAALFNPLRTRVQHLVDRRFNRARYDAEATVAAFASHLREAIDLESVQVHLMEAVGRTLAPDHASLWIRSGR